MFLLLEEQDERAVLEEALAFIDGLEVSAPLHDALARPDKPKKRKRDASLDVLRRRRNKEMRLALRHEADMLDQRLKILRQASENGQPLPLAQKQSPEWEHRAASAEREAAGAMKENSRLRHAVAQQQRLMTSLQKVLSSAQFKQELLKTAEIVRSTEQCPAANNSAEIMNTLKLDICRLKEDVEDALAGLILSVDGLSCSLTVKVDPTFGPYSDRTISMVVPRPLDDVVPALECISSRPTTISYVDVKYNVQFQPSTEAGGIEKRYTIELDTPKGTIKLAGVGYIKRFKTHDREAVLFSSRVSHSSGLQFLERGWLVADRLPSDPSKSVIHSCYRLSNTRSPDDDDSPLGSVCDVVQAKLGERMRTKMENIHRNVLNLVGPRYMDRFLPARGLACSQA